MTDASTALAREGKRHHVLIAGTGRAGTTFLMELLHELGMDTGIGARQTTYSREARAGHEDNLRSTTAPYVVKKPQHSIELDELIEQHDVVIDRILLPVRDISDAARSRVEVSRAAGATQPNTVAGGLYEAETQEQQELVLRHMLSELIVSAAKHDIPVTILHYPRLVEDADYVYEKLHEVFGEVDHTTFADTFAATVVPTSSD